MVPDEDTGRWKIEINSKLLKLKDGSTVIFGAKGTSPPLLTAGRERGHRLVENEVILLSNLTVGQLGSRNIGLISIYDVVGKVTPLTASTVSVSDPSPPSAVTDPSVEEGRELREQRPDDERQNDNPGKMTAPSRAFPTKIESLYIDKNDGSAARIGSRLLSIPPIRRVLTFFNLTTHP